MVSEQFKMNRSNAHREPIPLFCSKSTQTQDLDSSETEDSDFPPCRVGNSPPLNSRSPLPPPRRSRYLRAATSEEEPSHCGSQSQHCQKPNTGLGQTNIVNIATATTFLPTKVSLYIFLHIAMLMTNVRVILGLLFTKSPCWSVAAPNTLRMNAFWRSSIFLLVTTITWHGYDVRLPVSRRLLRRWLLRRGRTNGILSVR